MLALGVGVASVLAGFGKVGDMDYDALLAALLAGAITLLAFLFWPGLADQLPDLARMAIIYLVVLLAGSWIFGTLRRRRRK
ncbi:hypothetical protein [Methylocystis sp.]|uniref:hypothetical protein n=1 Tax=Methylocystis sp. TaxID=1911079 RepID=UPI0025D7D22F|nr:hypothetical protein [Methylocystis sp.]